MSTEGIPTPRTDQNLKENESFLVDPTVSRAIETELFLANQKLQAIRELVEKGHKSAIRHTRIMQILNS